MVKIGFFSQYRGGPHLGDRPDHHLCPVLISLIASSASPPGLFGFSSWRLPLLAMPLSLLLWALFPVLPYWRCCAQMRNVSTVLLIASLFIPQPPSAQMFSGSWLMLFFWDTIPRGARFYGIGNEFMGVLIGSAIMGWAIALKGVFPAVCGAPWGWFCSVFHSCHGAPACEQM